MSALWYNKLTVDKTKLNGANLTDFPVYVELDHADYKTVANGGYVNNASGYDICFWSDAAFTIPLKWELEQYDGTNGKIKAHVKVPTVSYTVDTDFYMTFKDSSISTFQGGTTGQAWNSNYKSVLHLGTGSSLVVTDSTANAENGTNSGASAIAGKMYGGMDVSGGSKVTLAHGLSDIVGASAVHTIEFWVNVDDYSGGDQYCFDGDTGHGGIGAFMNIAGGGQIQWGYGGSYRDQTAISPTMSVGTWYHIMAEKTASGNNGNLYVNGTLQTGTVSGSLSDVPTGASGLNWGAYHSSTTLAMDGKMDELCISNTNRGASYAKARYNNGNTPGNVGAAGFYTVGTRTAIVTTTTTDITKSAKYTVKTSVGITKGLIYDVRTTPAITKSLQYAIKLPIAITKTAKYTVRTTVGLTKSLQYCLKTTTEIQKTAKYTILKASGITKSLQYAIRTVTDITKSLRYAVALSPDITKTLKYTIFNPSLAVTKTLKYGVLKTYGITKTLTYAIRTVPAITKATQYAVRTSNDIGKDLRYVILVQTSLTKTLQYSVRTNTDITKQLKYSVGQTTAITKALRYVIKTQTQVTKTLKYTTKTSTDIQLELRYRVYPSEVGDVQRILRYRVKTVHEITKPLAYSIRDDNAILKTLQYVIDGSVLPHSITKSLRYCVRAYPYTPSVSPYTKTTGKYTPRQDPYTPFARHS